MMSWFETQSAKRRRLEQRGSRMIRALENDDAAEAFIIFHEGSKWDPVRDERWSSTIPAQPVLLLAILWGSASCFEVLLKEGLAQGLCESVKDAELMRIALLAGQSDMMRRLLRAGAPAPSIKHIGEALEKAQSSDGRRVRNETGALAIRRVETLGGRGALVWRDLPDPALEVAIEALPAGALSGGDGTRLLGLAGSGRRALALLKAGADPNPAEGLGVWPLERAMASGRKDWIEALMRAGRIRLNWARRGVWRRRPLVTAGRNRSSGAWRRSGAPAPRPWLSVNRLLRIGLSDDERGADR